MSDFGQLDFTGTYDVSRGGVGAVDLSTGHQAVRFYSRKELVPFKSEQEGRPVFRDAVYIRVETPGEIFDVVDREATPADKRRWGKQFAAFEEGRLDIPDGTPISALFPANPEIVDELKVLKVHTIEQLAETSDVALQNMGMGATEWQARARRYMDVTKDAGRLGKIEQRQRDLDFQVQQANEDNERLRARLAELEADGAKKGRRPIQTDA